MRSSDASGLCERLPGVAARPAQCSIREATPGDNAALLELAGACSMRGEVSIRVERSPDFAALNRLEGDRWQLAVAEIHGRVVGCVASSRRSVYVNGRESKIGYVGDLKVHPAYRGSNAADELSHHASREVSRLAPGAHMLITVLGGNTAMERRLSGPRGLPVFRNIGTIRSHSIPILWRRRAAEPSGLSITAGNDRDLEAMAALWARVAPGRQFAPVQDAPSLARSIAAAPGLEIGSYRLARGAGGELLGFVALWDQGSFKQMIVEKYSTRLQLVRHAFNLLAPVLGAPPLPRGGGELRFVTAFNVCVPRDRPEVLNALIVTAHNELRHSPYCFINIGMDTRDTLSRALSGLLAQPTDVHAYLNHGPSKDRLEPLLPLPLHYEIALV